jgi:hypothetical protein
MEGGRLVGFIYNVSNNGQDRNRKSLNTKLYGSFDHHFHNFILKISLATNNMKTGEASIPETWNSLC